MESIKGITDLRVGDLIDLARVSYANTDTDQWDYSYALVDSIEATPEGVLLTVLSDSAEHVYHLPATITVPVVITQKG